MDSNSDITEHGFDTSGGNSNFIEGFINISGIIFDLKSFLGFFIEIFSWNFDSFNNFEATNFDKLRILSLSKVCLVGKIPNFFLLGFFID